MSRLRTDDAGFTLIEAVISTLCVVLILAAGAAFFGAGDTSTLASQRQAQAVNLADQYIEQIRLALKTSTTGFAALAMNAAPSAGSSATLFSTATHTDPNDFVSSAPGCGSSNAGYMIESNWDNTGDGVAPGISAWTGCPTGAEPLAIASGTGIVTPKQGPITVGSSTAYIYSYVTDTNVGCTTTVLGACNTSNGGTPLGDAKRVIVAVVMNNGATNNTGSGAVYTHGQNTPVYVSTIFTNPVPSNQSNISVGLNVGATVG